MTITVRAPAKINLHLRILGRRPDGFHEVRTLLQSVHLHDTLTFRRRPGPLTVRSRSRAAPADRANLVWKAASALWTASGRKGDPAGAAVTIAKRIPPAAGLAGGSSDAAGALRGLCAAWGISARAGWLRAVAAGVGSDVPYLLEGGTVLARGRGERLRRVRDVAPLWVVLAHPPFGVSTAAAYRWFDEAGRPEAERAAAALPRGWRSRLHVLSNDLEAVVVQRHPEAGRMVESLRRTAPLRVAMTGSGSAVYGLYGTLAAARAARTAARRRGWRTVLTRTTGRAEFARMTAARAPAAAGGEEPDRPVSVRAGPPAS